MSKRIARCRGRLPVREVLVIAGLAAAGAGWSQTLLFENFDGLPLGPNVDEALAGEKVWTKTPPAGWVQDDSGVPGVGTELDGVTEWAGWSFPDKMWWTQAAEDQRRSEFTRASGTVMVSDPDEWDDAGHVDSASAGWYNTYITTPEIDVSGAPANSMVIIFDSSWRPEYDSNYRQTGNIQVSYDGGAEQQLMLWSSDSSQPAWDPAGGVTEGYKNDSSTNERIILEVNNPSGASAAKFTFGLFEAGNDWWWAVDNVAIGVPPVVTEVKPSPIGFSIRITDARGKSLDVSQGVSVLLDGAAITADVNKDGADTYVTYSVAPDFLEPNSTHTVQLSYFNNEGTELSDTLQFTVPDFPVVSPAMQVTGVDTSKPGFHMNVALVEGPTTVVHGNTRPGVEQLLQGRLVDPATGQPYGNDAYLEYNSLDGSVAPENGGFRITSVINYDQAGEPAGNFNANAAGNLNVVDDFIPGAFYSNDNLAAEFLFYAQLPRGAYRWGVNSDEGFFLTVGPNPKDSTALVLGSFNGARGAADTVFDFAVEEAGYYAFRLLYWEGYGAPPDSASVELFSQNIATGERYLINGTQAAAVKTFRAGPNPAYLEWVTPDPYAGAATPDSAISYRLLPGDSSVDAGSLKLTLDGQEVAASVQNTAGGYTVTYQPTELFDSESTHVAEAVYSVGGAEQRRAWTFVVQSYVTLPTCLATATGTGAEAGMKWRTHLLDASRGTAISLAEQQLNGDLGPSVHNPTGEGADGFFNVDFVNFEQDQAAAGNFSVNAAAPLNVADAAIPGIPGNAAAPNDNIAGECFAYLELTQAGIYTMGVNSDDGFQVSVGNRSEPVQLVLGAYDGGRGASDTLFTFRVLEPGVYLFRLLWFEGGGGASVEWFTVGANGSRALVNGTQAGALKSYRTRTVDEPVCSQEPTGLQVALDGANVVISWEGTATLEESSNLVDWGEVSGASSPYSAPADSVAYKFYRLMAP